MVAINCRGTEPRFGFSPDFPRLSSESSVSMTPRFSPMFAGPIKMSLMTQREGDRERETVL